MTDTTSVFMGAAQEMKQRLDAVSPSLCLAKWKQVSLHLSTGHTNSCYHPPLHKIQLSDIARSPSGIHNTEHKKQQRLLMLQGQRPTECQYCWNMEDLGELSDRHYRSGEPWAALDFELIANSDGSEDVVPSYVEVNFSNVCNLACSYCSPQFSTTWAQEVRAHGAYPTSNQHNSPSYFEGDREPIAHRMPNPYLEAFWRWWPDLYPQLKHFRMTGGEPLMDRNTYRVFDYVLANPKSDLHLNVTSNFSVEDSLFEKYLGYVKRICETNIEHFMQYVSLDSGNWPQAEYIRHGLDSTKLRRNVDRFLGEIPGRNSVTFIVTMNNLSLPGLLPLLKYVLDLRRRHSTTYQRVWFDTPVLSQPAWQSLQLLPAEYACLLEEAVEFMQQNIENPGDAFHGFKDYEVQRMQRNLAWMRAGRPDTQLQADFYRFFNEHDKRRGTDFVTTFPEMRSWWHQCQSYARQT
jgi:organic radical activating enzyme